MQDKKRFEDQIVIYVTGEDRPGIMADFLRIFDHPSCQIVDIDQMVVYKKLFMAITIRYLSDETEAHRDILKEVLYRAKQIGVRVDFDIDKSSSFEGEKSGKSEELIVTAVSESLSNGALAKISHCLSDHGCNIIKIKKLNKGLLSVIEIKTSAPESLKPDKLRADLFFLGDQHKFDVAMQLDSVFRKQKRLVVFDMDSTLIEQEVIDELARTAGVYDKVKAITEEAMQGKLNFEESLRKRVSMLKGTPETVFDDVFEKLIYSKDVIFLSKALKKLGYKLAVISGGFTHVIDKAKEKLGFDYGYANTMELKDGLMTGNVTGEIITPEKKAELLLAICKEHGIARDQVIAVGDGANDQLMLNAAGMGIAYKAKPALKESASYRINYKSLASILFFLGIDEQEAETLIENT